MPTQIPSDVATKARLIKLHAPTLTVSICGSWVWVSGDTRPHASTLAGLGFKFSRQKTKWYFGRMNFPRRRSGIPWGSIVQKYGEAHVIPNTVAA